MIYYFTENLNEPYVIWFRSCSGWRQCGLRPWKASWVLNTFYWPVDALEKNPRYCLVYQGCVNFYTGRTLQSFKHTTGVSIDLGETHANPGG